MIEKRKGSNKYIILSLIFSVAFFVCICVFAYKEKQIVKLKQRDNFFSCMQSSDVLTAKTMLEKDKKLVNIRDSRGRTPLFFASSKEMAELLINSGANINVRDNEGCSPLHMQASSLLCSKEVMKLLILKGANVNAKDNQRRTPLHYASKITYIPNIEAVQILIGNGADINAKDNEGNSPLKLSIQWKQKAVADLLRKHGAKE